MKLLSTFVLLVLTLASNAQITIPTLSLTVEEVIIPDGVFEPTLSPFRTFRVYAEIDPNWELLSIFGLMGEPMSVSSNGLFYQDPMGGPTSLDINEALFPANPALNYDSWLTIGAESAANNLMFVAPIDGSVFNAWEAGDDLLIDDIFGGSVSIPSPGFLSQNVADENGRILIGQFTASSNISGCLNLQFRQLNEDGSIYISPEGGTITEIFSDVCFSIPFLTFCQSDFNSSGTVNVSDLLILVSDYGCSSGCATDLTGDDATSSQDLLYFLSELGQVCNAEY
ncbi:MAG: hypothetical protein GC193_01060 [Cryomorphaceae bacterium]|nr:hypothetical protein [Cryomorphaceae bacterium]